MIKNIIHTDLYIEKLENNKYCDKYKNILYLCNFLYEK